MRRDPQNGTEPLVRLKLDHAGYRAFPIRGKHSLQLARNSRRLRGLHRLDRNDTPFMTSMPNNAIDSLMLAISSRLPDSVIRLRVSSALKRSIMADCATGFGVRIVRPKDRHARCQRPVW